MKPYNYNVDHLFILVTPGPVTTECVSNHDMHGEHFSVDPESLEELAQSLENGLSSANVNGCARFCCESVLFTLNLCPHAPDRPIVAVGTTSVRVLESLYWLGARGAPAEQPLVLGQWDAYNIAERPNAHTALRNLATIGGAQRIRGMTEMCIVPGYNFRVLERGGVITNFHQVDPP